MNYFPELTKFLLQAKDGGLKTKDYIKELGQLSVRVSFGQGGQARVPWIAFLHDTQDVMKGIYPVLLFYKSQNILILTYGISETHKPLKQWPTNVTNEAIQIKDFLSGKQERYGDSFVYKAYKVNLNGDNPTLLKHGTDEPVNAEIFDADPRENSTGAEPLLTNPNRNGSTIKTWCMSCSINCGSVPLSIFDSDSFIMLYHHRPFILPVRN